MLSDSPGGAYIAYRLVSICVFLNRRLTGSINKQFDLIAQKD